ncbi:DUF1559 domain-containing protein [Bremerella sp. JC770]|uniref:DUF1559 domain-containing protein n=1 Tax=Bremerella sp. JC770 TaxID=3232137 RepID=UPI0034588E47
MRSRNGFTLVELLVVIAIIGILIALLLPAVQQAREAARRMHCTSNLKQVVLATHNYSDSFGTLPPGWIWPEDTTNFSNKNAWGWGAMILPFIEQTALYEQIDFGWEWRNNASSHVNNDISTAVVSSYICPSDPLGSINTFHSSAGKSNYIGSYGNRGINNPSFLLSNNDGMFNQNSKVAFRDVVDGTSNTILFGERHGMEINGTQYAAGIWAGPKLRTRPDTAIGRGPSSSTDYYNAINGENNWGLAHSLHPGGANFGFVDGSVHFIPETVNLETYQYLIERGDGQVVPAL